MNLLQSSFPLDPEPVRARSPPRPSWSSTTSSPAPSACSTGGSSARSRRSSTPARSATSRCWSPPRSTPRTRSARRRSSTPTPASRTTTCAPTTSTSGSRSPPRPTPSSASQGTLEVLMRETGAESMRELPTLTLFKINMNLEMEKGTDALAAAVEAAPPRELEAQPYDERRHRRDPRPAGADGGGRAALRRGRGRARDRRPRSCSSTCAAMVDRKILRRVAAILYHRRAGFSANGMGVWKVPEDEIMETGGRMASFRGISHCYQRPTYEDWPYSVFTMAHGRSKEECDAILDSIAEECGMGPRRPRHPLLLDRVQEDPPALLHRRLRRAGRPSIPSPTSARTELYRRALQVLPGGVNSPVRAMRQIGREPIFIERGEGCELVDVDGNRYLDWVCSWGPLILGHADPAVVAAVDRGGRAGDQLRRRDRGRGRAGRGGRRARALGRDGADDQLRHRGGDERRAAGPRGHRPRGRGQVRRRLPRPLRRAARRGRLGAGDARRARQPRRHRGAGGGDRRRALERPRGGRASARRARGRGAAGRADRRQHGRRPARRGLPRVPPRGDPRRPARCSSSTR